MKKIANNKMGFTLMELIIVLVIVAILAAALIPSFLNFADRARNESLLAEARLGQVAAQVVITESGDKSPPNNLITDPISNDRFIELIKDDVGADGIFSKIDVNDIGRVISITYTRDGKSVTIKDTGVEWDNTP